MTEEITKEKKTRTPRNYENILKGAMSLTLAEKVNLVKELKVAIQAEVDTASKAAADAAATVNGL